MSTNGRALWTVDSRLFNAIWRGGKFYTTHMEDPSIEAPGGPQTTMIPGLKASDYTTTAPFTTRIIVTLHMRRCPHDAMPHQSRIVLLR